MTEKHQQVSVSLEYLGMLSIILRTSFQFIPNQISSGGFFQGCSALDDYVLKRFTRSVPKVGVEPLLQLFSFTVHAAVMVPAIGLHIWCDTILNQSWKCCFVFLYCQ